MWGSGVARAVEHVSFISGAITFINRSLISREESGCSDISASPQS